MKITKVNVASLAKVLGALYLGLGVIIAVIFGAMIIIGALVSGRWMTVLFGIGLIIVVPIVYGMMGLIAGYIIGWLYNAIAKWVGGIEIETE